MPKLITTQGSTTSHAGCRDLVVLVEDRAVDSPARASESTGYINRRRLPGRFKNADCRDDTSLVRLPPSVGLRPGGY